MLVGIIAGYSKPTRPKLARLDAVDAVLAQAVAQQPVSPKRKPVVARLRYRLVDGLGLAKLDEIVARYGPGESTTLLAAEPASRSPRSYASSKSVGSLVVNTGLTPAKERLLLKLRDQGMAIRTIASRLASVMTWPGYSAQAE